MEDETKSGAANIDISEPIIINLGKQRRKRIKNLMKGRGKLWYEVEGVIDEATAKLGEEVEGKTVVPLVLIYRTKRKRRRLGRMFGF